MMGRKLHHMCKSVLLIYTYPAIVHALHDSYIRMGKILGTEKQSLMQSSLCYWLVAISRLGHHLQTMSEAKLLGREGTRVMLKVAAISLTKIISEKMNVQMHEFICISVPIVAVISDINYVTKRKYHSYRYYWYTTHFNYLMYNYTCTPSGMSSPADPLR